MSSFAAVQGDCREIMVTMEEESIDALITDPPYGIGFMGKKWDTFRPGVETARVLKARESDNPNVKGRSRSPASSPSAVEYDRTIAGQREFQAWTESWAREVIRVLKPGAHGVVCGAPRSHHRMMSGLEDAGFEVRDTLMWVFAQNMPKSLTLDRVNGVGTALKSSWEPIVLIRKPIKKTIKHTFEVYGTGGLYIEESKRTGTWPANVLFDEDTVASLGPKSRFFYAPKVSSREREFGCDHLPARTPGEMTNRKEGSKGLKSPRAGAGWSRGYRNGHPTLKPIELMRWLVKLITPPEGVIIDPFVGSGSTAIAGCLEGHEVIGMDLEHEWLTVAEARVKAWMKKEGRNG